jgi:hypothetical protein
MTALAKASSSCKRQTILSSKRTLHKDYDRKYSVKKNTGRESQEACRQDELTGDKIPVVKLILNSEEERGKENSAT